MPLVHELLNGCIQCLDTFAACRQIRQKFLQNASKTFSEGLVDHLLPLHMVELGGGLER
jgi:hypothetical protein